MHILTVGKSGSGKTNLNKRFAANYSAKGYDVIIYDPLESGGWPEKAEKYSSPEKFLNIIQYKQSCYVFVDEAKTLWDFDEKEADKLLYKRRHQGLLVFVICQRAYMVRPNARNQCSKIFAFAQNHKDVAILKDDYHDELEAVKTLQENQFIASDGYRITYHKLDYNQGFPPDILPLDSAD